MVGQTAAEIRKVRPPEPYKGKGIRYAGRARAPKGGQARMSIVTNREARLRAPPPGARQGVRHGRAAAARRLPLEQGHLRPARSTTRPAARSPRRAGSGSAAFKGTKTEQAAEVGKPLAASAKKAGIETCVFDRGGYLYHGRVKALAEGAREGGLEF